MSSSIRAFADTTVDPKVRGYLHTPETPNGKGLVLTHGAGSNAQAPLLIALAETFAAAGFTILRCDLPYRQTRSFGPPGPADSARDRAGLKNAIAALKIEMGRPEMGCPMSRRICETWEPQSPADPPASGNIFLGGHSYGGRQCSMLCAELAKTDPTLVPALLLLSYPLHPPRKPEQQRTQHLPDLRTPTLFVHGTRDPFGSIAELEQAIKMIPAKTRLLTIESTGHDLGFKGKAKSQEVPKSILTQFLELSS
jgi:predicted alpha/beta-hydrolase family hydrolase